MVLSSRLSLPIIAVAGHSMWVAHFKGSLLLPGIRTQPIWPPLLASVGSETGGCPVALSYLWTMSGLTVTANRDLAVFLSLSPATLSQMDQGINFSISDRTDTLSTDLMTARTTGNSEDKT